MDKLRADVLHAWRSLLRRRAYFLSSAGTLALVLGANAAMFAVVSATFLRPLPFEAGERVVHLFMLPPGLTAEHQRNPLQQMDLVRFRQHVTTMKRVEGFLPSERVLAQRDEPAVIKAAYVTPGLLDMMGVRPRSGRTFSAKEEQAGHAVALVSHGYSLRAYGGAKALGQSLVIDGVAHTIVGITDAGFPPPFLEADVFTPLVSDPTPAGRNPGRSVVALAELADGATVEQANAEAGAIVHRIARELPRTHAGWTGGAESAREWQYSSATTPILVLFGATTLVLLIACANLANLTAAQLSDRSTELGLRVALGASPRDVLRLQLVELLLIGVAGVVPGLFIASRAVPLLLALDPAAGRALGPVSIDWLVQGFTAALAMATATFASILPALQAIRGSGSRALAEGTRRTAGSLFSRRLRRALVTAEVALCLSLLIGGGALAEGLRKASRTQPGFNPQMVLTAQLRLSPSAYATTAARAAVVDRVVEKVRAIPGVAAAGTTMNDFVPGNTYQTMFHVENRPTPDGQPHATQFRRVSPGYFRAMQIRQLRGRDFTEHDREDTLHVAVISRQLADQLFPGEEVLGRIIRRASQNAPATTIVGVVDDVRDVSLTQAPEPTLYLAWAQNNNNAVPVSLVMRTVVDPESVISAVREAVLGVDRNLPLRRVQTLESFLADSIAPERFRATVLGLIALLGLLLAALGIYGVAYRGVVDRTQEFAVRLALGSRPTGVMRLVLGAALRDVLIGSAVGFAGGAWLCAVLTRLVTNVGNAATPATAIAVAVLAAASLVATVVPAVRVLRVQPADALRV